MNKDIHCILLTVIFECGSYYSICTDNDNAHEKKELIINYVKENFCTHKVLDTKYAIIPKSMIKKYSKKIEKSYFLYAGCCAFGL